MKANAEPQIRRLDLTGPERRLGTAVKALGKIANRFSKSARRSLPFVARQRGQILPGEPSIGLAPGADASSVGPTYQVNLGARDSNAWAMLWLDTGALALILDGALGGPAQPDMDVAGVFGKEITAAQRALIARVARSLAEDLAACLQFIAKLGFDEYRGVPLSTGALAELPKDALLVDCTLEGLSAPGILRLGVGAELLESALNEQEESEEEQLDADMMQVLQQVSVPVVAELGRLELSLGRVLSLNRGETLRLSTAVDEPITLRVAGLAKFDAVPVVRRGQLGVEVRDRHRE